MQLESSCFCKELNKIPFGVYLTLSMHSGKHICVLLLSVDNHCIRGIADNELPIILNCNDICGFSWGKKPHKPKCELIKDEICNCFKIPPGQSKVVWDTELTPVFASICVSYDSGDCQFINVKYHEKNSPFHVHLHDTKVKTVKNLDKLMISCPYNTGKICKGTYCINVYYNLTNHILD
ncbi:S-Ena type endospore appendage [Pontibacillus sp. HMF3514]|uniref:S-Ena type endospore appendage n=1 Tax=Pontibacillus sp. HMF3514 TaxID=2692425 RepID=UPI001320308F|nr:S-Ena type endospore appendage [Pontibacillus sp. HMF3514]QHE51632.1 hypothetical protein GS400_06090 [Pontibacillus sp. HMF3514]